MAKDRYKFNPETLSYTKERSGLSGNSKILFFNAIVVVVLAFFLFLGFSLFFDSPKESSLKWENQKLVSQFNVLDKRFEQTLKVLEDIQKRDDNLYRAIFEAEPVPYSVRMAGFGGVDRYKELQGYDNSRIVIKTAKCLDQISKRLVVQSKSFDEVQKMLENKKEMLASIPAIQPIDPKDLTRFGSAFGPRIHPIYKVLKMHTGVDLTAPRGTKIYCAGEGKVTRADWCRGYGYMVEVDHGYTYTTRYAHMKKMLVKKGQKVKRGQVLGLVGSTGTSTSPHLHYEVRKSGTPVNPINFYINDLSPKEYAQMIENARNSN